MRSEVDLRIFTLHDILGGNSFCAIHAIGVMPCGRIGMFPCRRKAMVAMKILYSHRTRSADGQHVHISELTNALSARGHEIIMAGPASSARNEIGKKKETTKRSLKDWVPAPLYEAAEFGYSLPAYRRVKKLATEHAPDVVYERYNLFFHAGMWLKKRFGMPMLLEVNAPLVEERTAHSNLALNGLARKSEQSIWRSADKVLAVTNVLAEQIIDAGVSPEKIDVIHNGVSNEFLQPHNGHEVRSKFGLGDKLVLGFTGFMRVWHGVDRAIRFLAQSQRDDLHLLLVGDGPAKDALQELAVELGVASQVTFTGTIGRAALPSYIAAFDVALQPAVVSYASPLKLFEYMALGKPVVAPDSANIKEILTHGTDGLLFDGANVGAFDEALRALVEKKELRETIGAAARASLLRQGLTWHENARRVEAHAETLLGLKT